MPLSPRSPSLLGQTLLRLRTQRGLSQTALARKAGVTRSLLSKLEGGTHAGTSLPILQALAQALRCSVATLIGYRAGRHA